MILRDAFRKLKNGSLESFTYSGRVYDRGDLNNVVSEVKPRTERVEVKRWAKLGADGSWFGSTCQREQAHEWQRKHPDCFIQEISFTFDRPIPEEVTEVIRTVAKHQLGYGEMPLPAEWIGKKVRVELI